MILFLGIPFYMIYGGLQFPSSTYSNICTDVTAVQFNLANNCTTIQTFRTYAEMIYSLYRLTFGLTLDDVKT